MRIGKLGGAMIVAAAAAVAPVPTAVASVVTFCDELDWPMGRPVLPHHGALRTQGGP